MICLIRKQYKSINSQSSNKAYPQPLPINNQTLPPLHSPTSSPQPAPLPIQLNLQHPPNPRMKPPGHHNKVLLRNAINIIVLGVHIIAGPHRRCGCGRSRTSWCGCRSRSRCRIRRTGRAVLGCLLCSLWRGGLNLGRWGTFYHWLISSIWGRSWWSRASRAGGCCLGTCLGSFCITRLRFACPAKCMRLCGFLCIQFIYLIKISLKCLNFPEIMKPNCLKFYNFVQAKKVRIHLNQWLFYEGIVFWTNDQIYLFSRDDSIVIGQDVVNSVKAWYIRVRVYR